MIYQTDETRIRILAVARSLFTEKGLFDTQMIDVAAALEMSRTTLYRYYRDKLDLALAILAILLREVHQSWTDPGSASGRTGLDRVGLYLRQVWTEAGPNTGHHRYMAEFDAFFSGSRIPEGFKEKMAAALPGDGDPRFLQMILDGQSDGSIRPDLEPHLAMTTLLNAVRGLQQRVLLRGDVLVELHPHEAERLIEELITYLLKGIHP